MWRWRSRYSVLLSMGSSRAAVACSIMVPYWPMSVMRRSICRAMARASSSVGDVGLGALAGVERVEFFVQRLDFGFDVLADAGGVVVDFDGDLLEPGGDAGDGAA